MDPILIVYKIKEIQPIFKEVINNNKSNHLPYHNLSHLLTVFKRCFEGLTEEGLGKQESLDLLVAALLHDINHSGGKKTDDKNIEEALKSGFEICKAAGYLNDKDEFDERIGSIIRATQFPYVIEQEDLNIQQQIIRDADMMQVLEETWFGHTFMGLSEEMGISPEKLIDGQIDFLSKVKMNTGWGEKVWEFQLPNVIENLKKLKKII